MIEKIKVRLKGKSPLLMHRYPIEMEGEAVHKLPPEEQAEIAAYRVPKTNELYIPGSAILRTFINGAAFTKRGRGTLMREIAGCLFVNPEYVLILVNNKPTKNFVLDRRPVVNPSTKGRMIANRPIIDEWEIEFEIEFEQNVLSEKEVRKVVEDSINRCGFLAFRPQKKGPMGRSDIILWEPVK